MHLIITDNKKPQTNTDKSPERNREILEIILCFFLLVSLIFGSSREISSHRRTMDGSPCLSAPLCRPYFLCRKDKKEASFFHRAEKIPAAGYPDRPSAGLWYVFDTADTAAPYENRLFGLCDAA